MKLMPEICDKRASQVKSDDWKLMILMVVLMVTVMAAIVISENGISKAHIVSSTFAFCNRFFTFSSNVFKATQLSFYKNEYLIKEYNKYFNILN